MICITKTLRFFSVTWIVFLCHSVLYAQNDTIPKNPRQDTTQRQTFDEYLKSRKGLFGTVVKSLRRDTTEVQVANDLTRNEEAFKIFEGAVIKHIIIKDLPFGIPLSDTSKIVTTSLTRIANKLHHTTNQSVIRKNLFFNVGDTLVPYLMGDNETYLRQLPYLQDATIEAVPTDGINPNAVDVYVTVKDLFSLGGSIASLGLRNTDMAVREDNIHGSGNGFVVHGLYDMSRNTKVGVGVEYIQRNIGRSFTNLGIGYQSYYPSISGLKEDNYYYVTVSKPLVNRYMHWIYEFDAAYHSTRNMYSGDSIYFANNRYRFYDLDAWLGYNINSTGFTTATEDRKLRKLVGLRVIDQQFQNLPGKYLSQYSWRYASLSGMLASVSFYRQNFYKSQYIYAFGINEDIPEGLNLTFTTGYIKKENLQRPYFGINYQRSTFTPKDNYFSYILRAEGYLDHKSLDDINLLGAITYFDHLKAIGPKWNERNFVNVSLAKQLNTILNEPLYIDSKYALPAFRNGDVGGSLRASVGLESVFYSPWNVAAFRFAPFAFATTGLFTPYNTPVNSSNIYTIVGGGMRMRNESLIFGTLELRAYYFLKKNVYNSNWKVDISSNITFKNNSPLISRPDFINVN